ARRSDPACGPADRGGCRRRATRRVVPSRRVVVGRACGDRTPRRRPVPATWPPTPGTHRRPGRLPRRCGLLPPSRSVGRVVRGLLCRLGTGGGRGPVPRGGRRGRGGDPARRPHPRRPRRPPVCGGTARGGRLVVTVGVGPVVLALGRLPVGTTGVR